MQDAGRVVDGWSLMSQNLASTDGREWLLTYPLLRDTDPLEGMSLGNRYRVLLEDTEVVKFDESPGEVLRTCEKFINTTVRLAQGKVAYHPSLCYHRV